MNPFFPHTGRKAQLRCLCPCSLWKMMWLWSKHTKVCGLSLKQALWVIFSYQEKETKQTGRGKKEEERRDRHEIALTVVSNQLTLARRSVTPHHAEETPRTDGLVWGFTQRGQTALINSKPCLIIQCAGLLSSPLVDSKHTIRTCSLYYRRFSVHGFMSPCAFWHLFKVPSAVHAEHQKRTQTATKGKMPGATGDICSLFPDCR